MKTTKQKILLHALKLFNNTGVSDVSLRTIADEAGISVGNLQYHFKKREDIIEALYFQLVEKMDAVALKKTEDLLASFLNISLDVFAILYEYHFFLLDFITITRRNPKIKSHYAQLSKRREKEFLTLITVLTEAGLFREEALKNEYLNLYKRIELISNFWFSSMLIKEEKLPTSSSKKYALTLSQSLYPYLTQKGKKQYANILPSQLA